MSTAQTGDGRWNRFARELQAILKDHDKKLTDLYKAGVYREQVRRLRHSLRKPGRFPLLSLAEIDRIVFFFRLSPDEIMRLRAALVATAIERVLYIRQIPPEATLQASEELYGIVIDAMRKDQLANVREPEAPGDLAQLTVTPLQAGDENEDEEDEPGEEQNQADIDALDDYDNATLTLHLATLNQGHKRLRYIQEAMQGYQAVLEALPTVDHADPAAKEWRARAELGLQEAEKALKS